MIPTAAPTMSHPLPTSTVAGGRLVPTPGEGLALRAASLTVDAAAGTARVLLRQTFANPHAEPLRVVYSLPLPADAAVSGFAFRIGDRRIVGTVDEVKKARETFERAIAQGRTAAILEETRTSLFTQELGNIPPGAEVIAEISIDQPLAWIDVEGAWEWRFPVTAAPRYLGRAPDARVALDVADGPMAPRASMELLIRDRLAGSGLPESPSHMLVVVPGEGATAVGLGGGGVALDRDLVVRWPVAMATASAAIDAGRPAGHHEGCALLTVVPPARSAAAAHVPRDLVLLLDTSGSMDGEPLAQAKRVASALVSSLRDGDSVEMIEFSTAARRFAPAAQRATADVKARALAWLASLRAGGATEMLEGIGAALASLRAEAQRQVVVITDGLIGFEQDVVSAIAARLPRGSRVHALGVGSSANRTLLAGVARVGGGVEVIVGLGEDPERAAARLLARTADPVVVDLEVSGDAVAEHAPRRLPDLYAGAPARIALRLRPEGGRVVVRGRTAAGVWEHAVEAPALADLRAADGPAKLFARERAADLEGELSAGRDRSAVDADLVTVGLRYAIATRVTSWVAASEVVSVDPTSPTRRVVVPHELPHGMSAEGLGLRAAAPAVQSLQAMPAPAMAPMVHYPSASTGAPPPPMGFAGPPGGFAGRPPPPPSPAKARSIAMPASMGRMAPPPPPARPGPGGGPADAGDDEDVRTIVSGPPKGMAHEEARDAGAIAPDEKLAAPGPLAESAAAAPAAPAPAREEEGFFSGVARKVKALFGGAARRLRGRVVLRDASAIVLEIEVGDADLELAWQGATTQLVDATGATHEITIDLAGTTREGLVGAGLTFRLALTWAGGAAIPVELRLQLPGGRPALTIDILA